MLLKIFQTNNNEYITSFNITFLKPFIKEYKINDILSFIESLDPIIQQLNYENKPIDYRSDIINDLKNLPSNHSIEDIYEILKSYKKLYKYKEQEQIHDKTIDEIRCLQKKLVQFTWLYYGVVDDNSYYLFAHQDNKFPFRAVLIPIKLIPTEIKDKFDKLCEYGEYISQNNVAKEDGSILTYFMMLADNTPSNQDQLFSINVSGVPLWVERSKFIYKSLFNWAQSRNEYSILKHDYDIEKSIFLS